MLRGLASQFMSPRDWSVLRLLVPYFLEYRWRVLFALSTLLLIQAATLSVPFLFKYIVDGLDEGKVQAVSLPLALLGAYVLVRFSGVAIRELRDAVYGTVTVRAMRLLSLHVLGHLHHLDLEYHLMRKTGAISRDMDRGVNAIATLMRILTFQILNMLLSVFGVAGILLFAYDAVYGLIVLVAASVYAVYTVRVTEWRTPFIRQSNDANSRANTRAVDSLINFETVKYFGNETAEARLYDDDLQEWEAARRRNRYSLAALNTGQQVFVHAGMFGMMLLAAMEVVNGTMTLGDLVAINAFAVQVFVPLYQLGGIYRELKRCFTDVERMFDILEAEPKVTEPDDAVDLPREPQRVSFDDVSFAYHPDRPILRNVSFDVPAGSTVAVVGPSGSGKSTLARLLFRFYDVTGGSIRVGGTDIRHAKLASLRDNLGVVPQDPTLFNATLWHNIAYGNVDASREEVERAARLANLDDLIERLPDGYETVVGERGLRLSGGEKQRVAIARAIVKDPSILIFDEATSSLDSASEQTILAAIDTVARGHTAIVIAHRLSTVVHADQIVVLRDGEVVESGTHDSLLVRGGEYATLWRIQQREAVPEDPDGADLARPARLDAHIIACCNPQPASPQPAGIIETGGNTMTDPDAGLLAELQTIDTPTVCNALEIVVPKRRGYGYTTQPLVCARPDLPPMVGVARTACIRAAHPSDLAGSDARKLSDSYYAYIDQGPKPSIVVIQDLDAERGYGSYWGEVNSNIHRGFGCLGVITDGSVRDLPDIADGFQMLADRVGPSHAFVHVVDFGRPVSVAGMRVVEDDLIHADQHGAVVIPADAADKVMDAAREIGRRERVIIDAAQQPGFNIDKLREAQGAAAEIH